jgi:alkylation response protein AidB-like acyl-CoA dehydrogenase
VDFTFSPEQEMLRASVRERMAAAFPVERVAAAADKDGFDRSEWAEAVDAGWTGISVAESEGGAGLSFLEELLVAEELGRALYPGPFLASVVMALPALASAGAGDLAASVVAGERIATVAWFGIEGAGGPYASPASWDGERLSCRRLFVPNLADADVAVVIGRDHQAPGLWAVEREAAGARWADLPVVDRTRDQGELILDGAPARLLARGDDADAIVAAVRDRTLAALAAEACGVAGRALEMAVEHAVSRKQFGRPIGTFQAVSHSLAQAYLEIETARSLTYWAGWAVAERTGQATVAAAAAKAKAAQASVDACERAIQVHGGIGFTWEHPLHRYYKRALAIAATMGGADDLWACVAAGVLPSTTAS